jgi:hypothetical protein
MNEENKYRCPHCQKNIENDTNVTTIVSGSADAIFTGDDGHPNGNVKDIVASIIFHDECFLQIAGEEYYPRQGVDEHKCTNEQK